MTEANIDAILARGGLLMAADLSHTHMMQDYVRRKSEEEREDARLAAVMGCYDMPSQDGALYALEARACVGSDRAYRAACEGRPFMLPRRGPRQPANNT